MRVKPTYKYLNWRHGSKIVGYPQRDTKQSTSSIPVDSTSMPILAMASLFAAAVHLRVSAAILSPQ